MCDGGVGSGQCDIAMPKAAQAAGTLSECPCCTGWSVKRERGRLSQLESHGLAEQMDAAGTNAVLATFRAGQLDGGTAPQVGVRSICASHAMQTLRQHIGLVRPRAAAQAGCCASHEGLIQTPLRPRHCSRRPPPSSWCTQPWGLPPARPACWPPTPASLTAGHP